MAWGWFGNKTKLTTAEPKEEPKLLEDIPPKFEDDVEAIDERRKPRRKDGKTDLLTMQQQEQPNVLKSAVNMVKPSDFVTAPQRIPCFSQALSTGGVISAMSFAILSVSSYRSTGNWKNVRYLKSMNWAMVGFLVGSIVSWEQCRFKHRQELKKQEKRKPVTTQPRT